MVTLCLAILGLFGSCLTYYLAKQQQLDAEQRNLKREYYKNFIKALSDVAIDNSDDDAQIMFSESINSLIVIASPAVVQQLMIFHDFIKISNTIIPRGSHEWSERHDKLLKQLVVVIRQDIYGKEHDIDEFLSGIHLVGCGKPGTRKNG